MLIYMWGLGKWNPAVAGKQWPFASHPCFLYWALNMKQHQLLSQSSFYLHQRPADAILTVNDLWSMLGSMSAAQFMGHLQHYATKIKGHHSCFLWHHALQALLHNREAPTIFGQAAVLTITGLRCITCWCTPALPHCDDQCVYKLLSTIFIIWMLVLHEHCWGMIIFYKIPTAPQVEWNQWQLHFHSPACLMYWYSLVSLPFMCCKTGQFTGQYSVLSMNEWSHLSVCTCLLF